MQVGAKQRDKVQQNTQISLKLAEIDVVSAAFLIRQTARTGLCLQLGQVTVGAATCPPWHQGRAGTQCHGHLGLQHATLEKHDKDTAQRKLRV